jgi:hypothetical protein
MTGAQAGFLTVGSAADVRNWLVEQIRVDLVGPGASDAILHAEILPQAPSRWYLTGLLVPLEAPDKQRAGDADAEGDLDSGDDAGGTDDQATPDKGSGRRAWRPSSLGLSFLLRSDVSSVNVTVRWGEYAYVEASESRPKGEGEPEADVVSNEQWRRTQRAESFAVSVAKPGLSHEQVPASGGITLECLVRPATIKTATEGTDAKSVSLFLVNRKPPKPESQLADEAFIFQVELEIVVETGFLPRYTLHGLDSDDWDERVADLHYRDVAEYAVGHNTSAEWSAVEGVCHRISTCCAPLTPVPRVVPNEGIPDFELSMERLGQLPDPEEARRQFEGVLLDYRRWVASQKTQLTDLTQRRREVADVLLADAEAAASRIQDGIACLAEPHVLEAFKIANRAVARAARQRDSQIDRSIRPDQAKPPRWRPFQLAFLLLNLRGIVEPTHDDREIVDLLFFPTGGGKTEAYLGLAAFTIAYRRLCNPALSGAGLSVLMRYTLRLLTLDQLARASAVICALELERVAEKRLGEWPIEIGLWVGRGATPNRMGYKGDNDSQGVNARTKVRRYKLNTKKPLPIPIRECPWCGTAFGSDSFKLVDDTGRENETSPTNLELRCINRACEFYLSRRPLPIVTVDEPIYRRLPAFMIATVDKFAGMPWTGEISGFFGGADRYDGGGFYGPATPKAGKPLERPLLPPELVIQDELHLISGPLGTMVGLYEVAIDRLSSRVVDGREIRSKIVVSTATIRRAQRQVRAIFDRRDTRIFPPPGPNREDSFFAQSLPLDDPGSRHYLGLAVPGGSPKVLFLRSAVSLMAIGETAWEQAPPDGKNPTEPYMTLLAYFNALRELGGARRIVEEEVGPRLQSYSRRLRVGETEHFKSRTIKYDVVELTSRVSTEDVAEAKRRLAATFKGRDDNDSVDIALATNMISVGLDITRLGLMLVSGQPKTTSEYIQATSRVGRDPQKPGLVVVLLNVNKPRDRSHYERFIAYHSMFYRSVEATSVTPFSPRALDRALAPVAVALARLGIAAFTPSKGARLAQSRRGDLDSVAETLAARAGSSREQPPNERHELELNVRERASHILDDWARIATEVAEAGVELGYRKEAGVARHLLYEMLDTEMLPPYWRPFRAPRSLRDVEPSVLIKIETPDGQVLPEEG